MSDEDAQPVLTFLACLLFSWKMPVTYGLYEEANHEELFISKDDMVSYFDLVFLYTCNLSEIMFIYSLLISLYVLLKMCFD